MKLTKAHTNMAYSAFISKVMKPNQIKKETFANIFGYLNRLNRKIDKFDDAFDGVLLDNMMLPSNLSRVLEPRSIKIDISKATSPELRDLSHWNVKETTEKEIVVEKKASQLLADFKKELESNPECNIDEIPTTLKIKVQDSVEESVSDNYKYINFRQDLERLASQARVDVNYNSSVKSAIQDVGFLTIMDNVVINGNVKWDATLEGCFIPHYVKAEVLFSLDDAKFNNTVDEMLEWYFSHDIIKFLFN